MSKAQLDAIRSQLAAAPTPPDAPLADHRAGFEAMTASFMPADDVTIAAVDAGGVEAVWVAAPESDDDRVLLYAHGGGYCMGSVRGHSGLMGAMAKACAGRVLGVGYRLAPEHAFPAPVEDMAKAYAWLLEQGVAASRIGLAGDSAGGGLVIATLLKIRDDELPMPACAVCFSPWTDLTCEGESYQTRAAIDPMVTRDGALQLAGAYLRGADPRSPLASPVFADLRGLPPILIQVGDAEVLLSDATLLHEALTAAGTSSTLDVWNDMIHVWQLMAPVLDEGREAIQRAGAFIREKTAS